MPLAAALLPRDWAEAAIIGAIVVGSVPLGFVREWRAPVAVAQLSQRLALTAPVLRGGTERRVVAAQVVVGGVVQSGPRQRAGVPDRLPRCLAAHRTGRGAGAAHARPTVAEAPSALLLWSTAAVALATLALPYVPAVQAMFGFVALPASLLAELGAIVLAYLLCTEWVKRRLGAA